VSQHDRPFARFSSGRKRLQAGTRMITGDLGMVSELQVATLAGF
jgi:hypothetical protein